MPGVLALVAALAVACAEASVNYGESKFTVTGTVLCQDCTKNWNAYAYNGKPIAGSCRHATPSYIYLVPHP